MKKMLLIFMMSFGLVLALSVVSVWAVVYVQGARPGVEASGVRPNEPV